MNTAIENPALAAFAEEFGEVLDPVAFLEQNQADLSATFLKLHELTLSDGAISKKHKLLMHAAITASQHNREATTMHLIGARKAGATKQELLETAYTLIPVAGMPALGVFISAWQKAVLR